MLRISDGSEEIRNLAERLKALSAGMLAALGDGVKMKLEAERDLKELLDGESFFVVESGMLACRHGEKVLFHYDDGDLIGLVEPLGQDLSISSDFAVVLNKFSRADLFKKISTDPKLFAVFEQYSSVRIAIMTAMLAGAAKAESILSPEMQTWSEGEVIISQGEESTQVYTLLEGRADVLVDGVKVGEIGADEMFGIIAALSEIPRSATIRAQGRCMTLAIDKDRFIELIDTRPAAVLKLLNEMSRTIVSQNKRIVDLTLPAL